MCKKAHRTTKQKRDSELCFQISSTAVYDTGFKNAWFGYSIANASSIPKLKDFVKRINDTGLILGANTTELITHEYGHLIDFAYQKRFTSPSSDLMEEFFRQCHLVDTERSWVQRDLEKEVGSYINNSTKEFFAEAYRLYKHKKLPKQLKFVRSFMEKLGE
jgi:hypothetical protein